MKAFKRIREVQFQYLFQPMKQSVPCFETECFMP